VISLEAAPRALAVDATNNRLYAALHDADALVVIDGARHVVLGKVSGIPGASGVAVGDDRVYVTATASDELVVVDPKNYAIMQRVVVGGAPYSVVFDPAGKRIYVGNAGDDTVSVLDGLNAELLGTVQFGGLGHPHGLALDPIRGRLYVTYALTPKYRAVAAIDASSGEIISQLLGDDTRPLMGAYGISVDPLLGRVYVTTGEDVLTLTGRTLRVIRTTPSVGPAYAFGLQRDPLEGRLYIVDAWSQRVAVCRD
jgi:YVTN family beta-propeller protein